MSWPARIGTIAQPSGAQYQLWINGSSAWGTQDNSISAIQLTPKIAALVSNQRFVSASNGHYVPGTTSEEFGFLISSSKQCGFFGNTRRTSDDTNRRINTIVYNNGTLSGSKFNFVCQGNRDATFITTDRKLWYAWGEANGCCSLYLLGATTDWKVAAQGVADFGWEGQRVAIKTDGTLWSFGYTRYGTIATGSTAVGGLQNALRQVGTSTDWDDVKCCAYLHMVARKTGGTLWAWGLNDNGQLGDGTVVNRSSPVQIGALTTWTKIAAGLAHSAAVRSDGTLWSWGANSAGQLGHNNTTNRSSPVQVGILTTWANVFCGPFSTFAIKTDGTLWSWGSNIISSENIFGGGMLGVGDTINRSSPVQVGTDTDWTNAVIGSSYMSTRAVKSNGVLWTWGDNQYNCTLQTEFTNLSFNQVPTTNWSCSRHVACGRDLRQDGGTLALKRDNTLWYFGLFNPTSAETGVGRLRSSPTQVGTGSNWSSNFDLSANGTYLYAIDRNNKLWNLGTQNNTQTLANTGSWSRIAIGSDNNSSPPQSWMLLISTTGQLWAIGYNGNGQLGNNSTTNLSSFTRIGTTTTWKEITTGQDQSTLAIRTDGTLWSWGANSAGQLGLGNVANRSSPVQVGIDTNWSRVSCHAGTTHAIKTTGTLWAWGYNGSGEFGNSSTINRSSPVQVGTDTNWKQVESYGVAIGLKTTGTLWMWGFNSYASTSVPSGKLPWNLLTYRSVGNNTGANTSSPVQIGFGYSTWTWASCGKSATSAIVTR
jgi:alpha-tubulin suppressor-like RCC1 family protein